MVPPRGVETEPLDCESHERDLLIVLWDDPVDLCVLCLDLWDFWVSSDAEKDKQAQVKKYGGANKKIKEWDTRAFNNSES